jgi:hypothetical protein
VKYFLRVSAKRHDDVVPYKLQIDYRHLAP